MTPTARNLQLDQTCPFRADVAKPRTYLAEDLGELRDCRGGKVLSPV